MSWRAAWLLPLAMLLCSFASLAQVGQTSDKDVGDCDRYASIDDIPTRGIKKADYGFIDIDLALPPCSAAYASNPKNSRVQAQLARIYFQQGKFEQGIELARASAKDHAISLSILGEASRRGVGGVPLSPREAAKLFQEGVERGNSDSMRGLAGSYSIGIGVEKDTTKALLLLQRSASLGDSNSIYSLAAAHLVGKSGLAKNPDEATNLVRTLAESGSHPGAQLLMGFLVAQRDRKISSEAKAFAESATAKLERFAAQNSAEARSLLAANYRSGLGVTKDLAKALDLYRKAAEHNLIFAIAQIGIALVGGNGTERNVAEGKKFLERASAMGSDEADAALASLWGK
jgi:TPR repeat protein